MNHVVIGATGGIGAAVARALPEPRLLAARNTTALRDLTAELTAYGVPVDVTRELEVAALASEIAARGGASTVVYAVGDIVTGGIADLAAADLERVWGANLLGAQQVLKHLAPVLTPQARLYFLGARADLIEYRGFSAYAAAKAGLDALCRVAQKELRRPVTVVKPGAVNTAFWKRLGQPAPRGALEPERVAAAIVESLTRTPVEELLVER